MKNFTQVLSVFILLILSGKFSYGQAPTCDATVPYYTVDLTGLPAGTWLSSEFSRMGYCCSATSADRCASFHIILDSNAAMVNFSFASGAIPPGSLYYQIDCAPPVAVGSPICVTGSSHYLTFCKPGNNTNSYKITSIPKPVFPRDDSTRLGCSKSLRILGLVPSSITWTSIYPGAAGAYNSYLTLADSMHFLYTPGAGAPAYVDYRICGNPLAMLCGFVSLCDTIRVYNFSPLAATVSPDSPSFCAGGIGVAVTVSASGGAGPYTYIWRNSVGTTVGTAATYTASIAGNYTVEIRDALYTSSLCPGLIKNVQVFAGLVPVVNAGADQIVCLAAPVTHLTGSVAHATGGVWTGGAGTFSPGSTSLIADYTPTSAEMAAGSVDLILTSTGAGGGCTNKSDTIHIVYSPLVNISMSATSAACNGSTNGTATATASGGFPAFTYNWSTSPVQTTSTATGLAAGTYTVTVTDAHGCTASSTATVTQPGTLTASALTAANVSCNGGNNGAATVTAGGGTAPYSYSWSTSPVQTTSAAAGLTAGTYTVTVTDAHGCTATATTTIAQPTTLTASASTMANVLCNGGNNGSATVTPTGGTTPYLYSWSTTPVQTTAAATGLTAGTYTVTVTDAHSCTATSTATITQPTALTASASTVASVACNGGNDGSATVTPGGGTTPYTYSWNSSPVQTTSAATGLTAGTYTVTVTDAHSCTAIATATIGQPLTLTASASTGANVLCNGGSNGSATATHGGGTAPYTYSWSTSPVQTTSTATGLAAGTYTVTITDAHNCTAIATATISQPLTLTASASTVADVLCNGGNNGSVTVTAGGGTTPYTYHWSTSPVQTTSTATGLTAGTYTVTITDAHNCTATSTAAISQPLTLTASASTLSDVSCNGGNNGSATVTPGGGTAPYTYHWSTSPVQTTSTATGLTSGTYTVTVTDAHNCTKTATATITQPATLTASASTLANVSCNGGNNGSATVTIGGGTAPYTYSWSTLPVQTTSGASGLTAGTYTVTVTDANGCTAASVATITQPAALAAVATALSNVACNGGNTGSASVTASGGSAPYTHSWSTSPVQTASVATTLTAGVYTVTVTDTHGCITTATTIINEATTLMATASAVANVSCNGGGNGSASLLATGGTTPYTYTWNTSPVQTTSLATGLSAGTYIGTVTDALGCNAFSIATITQPATLTASAASMANVSCNGGNNGSATVTPGGGTAPYTYNWSSIPAQTTSLATGLTAGTYTVTAHDAHGCTAATTVTITQPTVLTALASTAANVSCNGGDNGSATVAPGGGTSPYTYSWSTSPVQTTATATDLTAGTYTVIVTDAHNCTATSIAVIAEPTVVTASASTVANVSCNSGNNGSVTVTAGGGTAPYTFNWSTSPVQTTATANGLAAGTYTVTVTDAHGCTALATATVAEPEPVTASASVVAGVSCNGGNNGSATAIPGGGTSPYSYHWSTSPVQTTVTATGLTAGTYTVTVTDAHNCTATATVTISQPLTLTAAAAMQSNVSCNGGGNGSAAVTPGGGTAPYTYSWSTSPVQTTSAATGLTAGTYTATVTDAHGCTAIATVTITEPATVTASTWILSNVFCNGGNNGAAAVAPGGGTPPYTISWSTAPVQTTANAAGLAAGNYTVTITDANGCTATATATIGEPTALTATATALTDVACNGGNTGSASVVAVGGTSPYTYNWSTSPAQTSSLATTLTAGTYTATVTDAHGCITTAATTINEATSLAATASTVSDVSCNGGNNGSVTVSAAGGSVPYTYSWATSPVQTTATATGQAAGTYLVTVTDSHGCHATSTATVAQPTMLTASASTTANVSCNGGNNGSAAVIASGGTAPYTYNWTTSPVQTTATATGLTVGIYTVTVTDAHGCIKTATATITQPAMLTVSASTLDNVLCNGGDNGSVTGLASGGTVPYTYSWSTLPVQVTATATGLTAGAYTVTVTDSNGCIASSAASVTEPASLVAVASTVTNVACNGGTNGVATVVPGGGTPLYTYSWSTSPVQTVATAIGLTAGTYTVTVTDAHGCATAATTTVNEATTLMATASTVSNVSCNSGANGSAAVIAAGGTTPYGYSWNTTPTQTTSTAAGLAAGTYTVTVTDSNGCHATSVATITEPATLTAAASTVSDVSCNGGSNGSAAVIAGGGTAPYGYGWSTSPAQTTATAEGLTMGTYTVTVTDSNGCTATAIAAIAEPATLTAAASTISNVSCNGGNNGSATVASDGGTLPYSYNWSTTPAQTAETATGLPAGTYTVTVSDAHNCTVIAVATITEPAQLAATASSGNILCNGGTTAVTVAATGGTIPYTGTGTFTVTAGAYSYIVTDSNGCSVTAVITVTQPDSLMLTTTTTDASCDAANNGSATVMAIGGSAPYTYQWDANAANQVTPTATGLTRGACMVTVTDKNGCVTIATATVNGELTSMALASRITTPACYNNNDGSVHVITTGGIPPYTCAWSNGAAGMSLKNAAAGDYTITVTDSVGCTASATYTIPQPARLGVSLTAYVYPSGFNVSGYGNSDGSVKAEVSGGTAPYIYVWSNGSMLQEIVQVPAGDYKVTVTDSNGCIDSAAITLNQPDVLALPTGYSPNGDGKNDFFVIKGIEAYPNNHLLVFNRWGNEVYGTDGYNNIWDGRNKDGNELPDGTYFVILTINGGDITRTGYVDLRR